MKLCEHIDESLSQRLLQCDWCVLWCLLRSQRDDLTVFLSSKSQCRVIRWKRKGRQNDIWNVDSCGEYSSKQGCSWLGIECECASNTTNTLLCLSPKPTVNEGACGPIPFFVANTPTPPCFSSSRVWEWGGGLVHWKIGYLFGRKALLWFLLQRNAQALLDSHGTFLPLI